MTGGRMAQTRRQHQARSAASAKWSSAARRGRGRALSLLRLPMLGRGSERIGLVAVGVTVAIVVALQPSRLFPFTSATMWLYLPVVLLVTLRWGVRYGLLTALAATLVIPTFFVNRAAALLMGGAGSNVLQAVASVGMLGAVLGVADLNRRRLATEQERHRETEALLTTAEELNGAAEPQQALSHVVETIGQMLRIRRAAIRTRDGEYSFGAPDANEAQSADKGMSMAIAISGRDG